MDSSPSERAGFKLGSEAVLDPSPHPAVLILPGNSTATRVKSTWLSEYDNCKCLRILRKLVSISRSFPTGQLSSSIHRIPHTPSLFQRIFYFLTEDANLRGTKGTETGRACFSPWRPTSSLALAPLWGLPQFLLQTTSGFSSKDSASATSLLLQT